MFKKWIEIFKKDNLLRMAYQQSFEMLNITQSMFAKARESFRQREDSEIDLSVKETDKKVNSYEREVRRKVFNHLVVVGSANLPSGLALISIIIDIERIGFMPKKE